MLHKRSILRTQSIGLNKLVDNTFDKLISTYNKKNQGKLNRYNSLRFFEKEVIVTLAFSLCGEPRLTCQDDPDRGENYAVAYLNSRCAFSNWNSIERRLITPSKCKRINIFNEFQHKLSDNKKILEKYTIPKKFYFLKKNSSKRKASSKNQLH